MVPPRRPPDCIASVNYAKAEKPRRPAGHTAPTSACFCAWCDAKSASALPASAETVAAYLAAVTDRGTKASDPGPPVGCYSHKLANVQTPTDAEAVKATLRGIRRTLGAAKLKKAPAIAERIKAMVRTCPETTAAPAILLNLLRSTNPTLKEAFKALTEQDAGKSQL